MAILVAEDDLDDQLLIKEAFEENRIRNPVYFVEDGEELLDFLKGKGKHSNPKPPRPGLILLDLNMPKKDGREALAEIKTDPDLKRIVVVVLTTSRAEEDIFRSYQLGVNSFITKPVLFKSLVAMMKNLTNYWFEIVELPRNGGP